MHERRLTRDQTIQVLDRRARQMGINDFTLSLRQLDRWLAQEVGDPRSVRCRVIEAEFGHRIEKLLSTVPGRGVARSGFVGLATTPLEHFGAIVSHLTQIDHDTGAASALGPATEVYRSVLASASQSNGCDRDEGLELAARCAELVGWFHQDAGSPGQAREWTAKALDLAEAAAAKELTSYLLMRRSAVAAELGIADEALLLAGGALRHAKHDVERALASRQLAVAHALKGDPSAVVDAAEAAISAVTTAGGSTGLAPYCSVSYIRSEVGSAALAVGDPRLAVEFLEPAAAGWPTDQRRDRSICLVRLALAYARRGDLDRAEATAFRASDAAVGCGSNRFDRTLRSMIDTVKERGGAHRVRALADRPPR